MPSSTSAANETKKLHVEAAEATYETDRYLATQDNLRETLDKYGVAILPGVLNEGEIQAMNDGMWDTLEQMTSGFSGGAKPIDRKKKNTWANIEELKPMHGFLIQHWGIGHAKYVWEVRANQKVCAAFSTVHDTPPENLVTSFDAVSILLPDGRFGKTRTDPKLWLHTDQRFNYEMDPYRYSVQAWVTGFDVAEGSATLAFLEGSHKHHAAFAEKFGYSRHGFDWWELGTEDEFKYLTEECGCVLRAIKCPAGSMVMFDSRLFHSGMAPPSGAQPVPRHVVYVCMSPKNWCKEHHLYRRKEIFLDSRMTAHTPHVPRLFSQFPRGYHKDSLPVKAPPMFSMDEMTERMKTLVPLDPQDRLHDDVDEAGEAGEEQQ
mmetsp:Transcript_27265/g.55687  ORF Transcript_27265/g.55687 Transcript_27265/m.55687 type:complete len:375 (+) Transcript_27265:70-1194(+)|eukprot:CAMPEP_0181305792 /NCGR_PEP_ID=MMETSP1101-20121128/9932_1 /TAXON_ID=46948 /ORGANISM="Rhodomonas abbreviata, Strain Caron Lab Isolate" /LENGTH=374 /DNA_ID=CAMNT_0023411759 /DNA_START=66 /DNA_END=1190 /DNA_ORIENTATION=+